MITVSSFQFALMFSAIFVGLPVAFLIGLAIGSQIEIARHKAGAEAFRIAQEAK